MTIIFYNNDFKYEIEAVTKLFFPAEHFNFLYDEDCEDDRIISIREEKDGVAVLTNRVVLEGEEKILSDSVEINDADYEHKCEQTLCKMLFLNLSEMTGTRVPWGTLTGIRPVKRINKLSAEGLTDEQIERHFREDFYVSQDKIDLAMKTARTQAEFLTVPPGSFSLYISIPFCPTRCSYCSFVSHSIESAKKLIPEYVEKLCLEIRHTARIADKLGLRLDTIYMGGGTPTSISAEEIEKIMKTTLECFDTSHLREYTVEAGRADTITPQKLKVIKDCGATRISINPQTMNDDVLKAIGRKHTAEQTVIAYNTAREWGHTNINMDLIAGLPEDNLDSFKNSVDELIKLSPENITVHTLSLKRSSTLYRSAERVNANMVSDMVSYAGRTLGKAGYNPYYLYRQKNTLGNLENSGYSKSGFESLYNIFIMEEIQSIFAVGAAASTKLIDGERLERIYNYKFPYEYISRFEEILRRKDKIIDFYGGN